MADTHQETGRLSAAARTVIALHDAEHSPASYAHGQAVGAVRVWADLLGYPDNPERAIDIAQVHLREQELRTQAARDARNILKSQPGPFATSAAPSAEQVILLATWILTGNTGESLVRSSEPKDQPWVSRYEEPSDATTKGTLYVPADKVEQMEQWLAENWLAGPVPEVKPDAS